MKMIIASAVVASMAFCMAGTTLNYTVQRAAHPDDVKTYDTTKLRARFVMEKVMAAAVKDYKKNNKEP